MVTHQFFQYSTLNCRMKDPIFAVPHKLPNQKPGDTVCYSSNAMETMMRSCHRQLKSNGREIVQPSHRSIERRTASTTQAAAVTAWNYVNFLLTRPVPQLSSSNAGILGHFSCLAILFTMMRAWGSSQDGDNHAGPSKRPNDDDDVAGGGTLEDGSAAAGPSIKRRLIRPTAIRRPASSDALQSPGAHKDGTRTVKENGEEYKEVSTRRAHSAESTSFDSTSPPLQSSRRTSTSPSRSPSPVIVTDTSRPSTSRSPSASGLYLPDPAFEGPPPRSHLVPRRTDHPPLLPCRSVYNYTRLNHIEEGTYGVVFRAKCNDSGGIYALKKLKLEEEKQGFPITSLREVMALMVAGSHENVVGIREIVVGDTLNQ